LLNQKFSEIATAARAADSTGDSSQLMVLINDVQGINDALNDRYNRETRRSSERKDMMYERLESLSTMVEQYTNDLRKQEVVEIQYEKLLIKNETLRQDRWCRHVNDLECGSGYGCFDAQCVSSWGGNEVCYNQADDDLDGKMDCEDPDCNSDDSCLCEQVNCDKPHQACNIVSADLKSGADISSIYAVKSGNTLYVMMQLTQTPNPDQVMYGFHIWNDEAQRGMGFNYRDNQVEVWSDQEVESSGVQTGFGSVVEFGIPLSMIGNANRYWIDGWTSDTETWTQFDHTDRGVSVERSTGVTVTVDGLSSDWSELTPSEDIDGDVKYKDGHCWCEEEWRDCDGNWENGCESSEPCPWEIHEFCGMNAHESEDGCECDGDWYDCDFDGNCESQETCFDESVVSVREEDGTTTTYVCNGIESPVPCDMQDEECGMNQHLGEDGLCYCDEGWYDWDEDGNCLDTGGYNVETEICDNGYDDDNDNLVDCADLQDCPDGILCVDGACMDGECIPDLVEDEVLEEPPVEEEVPPEEVPPEEPEGGLTGAFISVFRTISGCTNDNECAANQVCDVLSGNCFCEWLWYDCDGQESNGCESEDPTCGGRFDPCGEMECSEHQTCIIEMGGCMCDDGWYDCDGDWDNGCESTSQCVPCQSDSDCAPDRCAPWGDVVQEFGCYAGNSWVEESGRIQISGTCQTSSSGEVSGWISVNGWGSYEPLMREKQQESEQGREWCEREINSSIIERQLLQSSLNQEFMSWFFEEYVSNDPTEWHTHIGGIYDVYWKLVDNIMRVGHDLQCLGTTQWPDGYELVDVSYSSEYGDVHIWEEWTTTDFFGVSMSVPTPYMTTWIFPPKEIFKEEMKKGPPQDEESGPSKDETAQMKNNTMLMGTIERISNLFGGSADFLFQITDDNEVIFNVMITVNPEVVMSVDMDSSGVGADLTMVADYEWFYNLIKTQEQEFRGDEIESPPWSQVGRGFDFDDIRDGNQMFMEILYGIRTGAITVNPPQYITLLIQSMQALGEIMGRAMP
jgi:hypothetical protein